MAQRERRAPKPPPTAKASAATTARVMVGLAIKATDGPDPMANAPRSAQMTGWPDDLARTVGDVTIDDGHPTTAIRTINTTIEAARYPR